MTPKEAIDIIWAKKFKPRWIAFKEESHKQLHVGPRYSAYRVYEDPTNHRHSHEIAELFLNKDTQAGPNGKRHHIVIVQPTWYEHRIRCASPPRTSC